MVLGSEYKQLLNGCVVLFWESELILAMMAAEEGLPVVTSEEISGNTEFSGSALLVVIGEPFSDDHKELIVERLTKGLCVITLKMLS